MFKQMGGGGVKGFLNNVNKTADLAQGGTTPNFTALNWFPVSRLIMSNSEWSKITFFDIL